MVGVGDAAPAGAETGPTAVGGPRLGLRENAGQFAVFTLVTLLVGMTIGVERVALPPLARQAFGITSVLTTVSFLAAFGAVKAVMNLVSGRLSDRHGRKALLLAGWVFAVPYAVLIIMARSWWWVVAANLALGVNQALTWTMAVTAKIDLVGPVGRGLAVGIDESAGYLGVGLGGFAAGALVGAAGLRPAPYLLVLGVVAVGMVLSAGFARDTLAWARAEAAGQPTGAPAQPAPPLRSVAATMSWRDPSMLAVCQAGLVNKFADSLVAAFVPLYALHRGLALTQVGLLVGVYAWVWGLGQVAAGMLADRIGRKGPITAGTLLIAAGTALTAASDQHLLWYVGMATMGVGMALAYPNLITAVGDSAHPSWRGTALGVYRLWRDGGYALGPLVLGAVAAAGGIGAALWAGAALSGLSGLVLLGLFSETHPERRRRPPPWHDRPGPAAVTGRGPLPARRAGPARTSTQR